MCIIGKEVKCNELNDTIISHFKSNLSSHECGFSNFLGAVFGKCKHPIFIDLASLGALRSENFYILVKN